MATKKKSGGRKYGKAAGKTVASAMRRKKHGILKSGKSAHCDAALTPVIVSRSSGLFQGSLTKERYGLLSPPP